MNKIVDLTQDIYTGMPVFPGHHKTVVREQVPHEEMGKIMDEGYSFQGVLFGYRFEFAGFIMSI